MLTQYSLKMPKQVFGGENSLDRLAECLQGVKKAAVFTDAGIEGAGLLEPVLARMKNADIPYDILKDLPPEPTYSQAQALVDAFKSSGCDYIIAVGGGSVMDTAKLASLCATDEYGIKELLDEPLKARKTIKTLMIPTTAGTGAEATPNAIVAVPEKELKVGIVNPEMIADTVILDPEMIKKLPRKIAASTGVDALCHAIECFTGNKANPFSDIFALEALDLILNNIERACDDPEAIREKINMQLGSFYAGIAITASGTTAVHALSYPLGGKYHIAHGVSNAILLMPVMRFNESACREKFAAAYDRCIRPKKHLDTEGKSNAVLEKMDGIVKHLNIPTSLAEFGVPKEDLEGLVKAGMEVQRLLTNNMREVTAEDARKIYQEVL